jgi:hypothetical protein
VAKCLCEIDFLNTGTFDCDLWPLWPVLLMLKLDRQYHIFVYRFCMKIVEQSDTLQQIDRLLATFDLIACHSSFDVERLARQFFLEVTGRIFTDCKIDVQVGLILRALVLLLLHINDSPEDGLHAAFAVSPFCVPTELDGGLPDIASIADVVRILCGPTDRRSYRFGFQIDARGCPLFRDLFEVTRRCMACAKAGNEMIVFWNCQFASFADRCHSSQSGMMLNQIAALFYETAARENVRRLKALKQTIFEMYDRVPFDAPDPELGISMGDIEAIRETKNKVAARNSQRFAHLVREQMHELSPWLDSRFRCSHERRVFRNCRFGAQPLIRAFWNNGVADMTLPGVLSSGLESPCFSVRLGREVASLVCRIQDELQVTKGARVVHIRLSDIKRIHFRSRFLRQTAIEIFLRDGGTHLLDFRPASAMEVARQLRCPPIATWTAHNYMQRWIDGQISSFQYLMLINEYAGRSFNDANLYPIFPWIVWDFSQARPIARNLRRPFAESDCHSKAHSYSDAVASLLNRVIPFSRLPRSQTFSSLHEAGSFFRRQKLCTELPPDFFFSPASVTGFDLPTWAHGDPDAFVYFHRKLLECDAVSRDLHVWIDLVFGYATHGRAGMDNSNLFHQRLFSCEAHSDPVEIEMCVKDNGQMPSVLFSQAHPPRRLQPRQTVLTSVVGTKTGKELVHASVVKCNSSTVIIVCVSIDGAVDSVEWVFLGQDVTVTHIGNIGTGENLFTDAGSAVICIDKAASFCHLITREGMRGIQLNFTAPLFAVGKCGHIAISGVDGQVMRFPIDYPGELKPVCTTANDYISAFDWDPKYGIVAVGTWDGHLVISFVRDGGYFWSADVGETPLRISITQSFGFILVETKSSLTLFNCNGKKLRSWCKPTDFAISGIRTWKCERGFDYFALSDVSGRIHIFEAFFLNVGEHVYECGLPVVSMFYSVADRILVAVTSTGEFRAFPAELPSHVFDFGHSAQEF